MSYLTIRSSRLGGIAIMASFLLFGVSLSAQNLSVSTNIADWADLGTINADMSYSIARHWSIGAGAQYNPFRFTRDTGDVVQDKRQSYSFLTRFWPWHVYSGWFIGGKVQYQEFNRGGLDSPEAREGDRYGTGFSTGYAKMLGSHVNLELGLSAWMGREKYTVYSCPVCGTVVDKGEKNFLLPDSLILSLAYIF